jgi:hypothetical protein
MKYTKCIIDICIIFLSVLLSVFLYFYVSETYVRYSIIFLSLIFVIFWGVRLHWDSRILGLNLEKKPRSNAIKELALLSEERKAIKTWYIYGMTSAIIGKSTIKSHADIDLRDTAFSSLIDPEHAVLNYAEGNWYLEDNDSRNGISIEKNGDSRRYYISKREPVIIELGDIIYIANTRLTTR